MSDMVGYGKPPEHGQFQKGRSGNPRGRPNGSRNVSTILADLLDRRVRLTIDDREVTMTARDAIAFQAVKRARDGSMHHIAMLLEREAFTESKVRVIYFEKGDETI